MKIILSIDGGGMRGVIPAAILVYLENKIQEITEDPRLRIGNVVDFVAGTSTGSIIGALMLIPDETGI
jgi:patatin-like phospholipase/acyl hydrolase